MADQADVTQTDDVEGGGGGVPDFAPTAEEADAPPASPPAVRIPSAASGEAPAAGTVHVYVVNSTYYYLCSMEI